MKCILNTLSVESLPMNNFHGWNPLLCQNVKKPARFFAFFAKIRHTLKPNLDFNLESSIIFNLPEIVVYSYIVNKDYRNKSNL